MSTSRLDELLEDLEFLPDPLERLRALLDLGAEMPPFPPEARTEGNAVRGCQSQVWLTCERVPGDPPRLFFRADADAQIVRGLAALVVLIFSYHTPAEILAIDPTPIFKRLDLERQLTPGRQNGLAAMVARIQAIAQAEARQ